VTSGGGIVSKDELSIRAIEAWMNQKPNAPAAHAIDGTF
jgi:hypothetical protein